MSARITLSDGAFVRVDDEDAEWAAAQRWSHSCRSGGTGAGYATHGGGSSKSGRWLRYMHREIAVRAGILDSYEDPRVIDHIDRDRLNNTRGNLRAVDYTVNNCNRPPRTSSGRVGIYKHKTAGWGAEIKRYGVRRRKYGFRTPEEAAAWRAAQVLE